MTASTRQVSPLPVAHTSKKPDPTSHLPKDQLAQNQVPPLTNYNLFLTDGTLVKAVEREGAAWAKERISELGRLLGTEEAQRWAVEANENKPVLHTHDRFGNRRDEVVFHPSWHKLMETSVAHQVPSLAWREKREGAHVARAILMMITAQNELGHGCPISMTFSGVAALRAEPELALEWEPRALSPSYNRRFLPRPKKLGVQLGLGLTKKQGGSNVGAKLTRPRPVGRSREY